MVTASHSRSGHDVGTGELTDQLQAIPGVAAAEVTLRDGEAPVARIWLDGSGDPDEVRERVRALLGSQIPTVGSQRPTRRSGLGRGLGELLIDDGDDPVLPHISGAVSVAERTSVSVRRVAVVETGDGVHVEIEDGSGNRRSEAVGHDGSIDTAVIGAIRRLLVLDPDLKIDITDVAAGGGDVVLVTTLDAHGRRAVGAALVEFGRPWALALAVVDALRDGR
jgi:hypothetical protein